MSHLRESLPKTKPELQELRADLIKRLENQGLSIKDRMETQLHLTEVNSAIKHLNKLAAADAQRDAEVRRALGRQEAQANTARAEECQAGMVRDNARDEDVLIRAKQLMRAIETYPGIRPSHFDAVVGPLLQLIDVQRARLKGEAKADAERESTWRETWTEPK